MDHRAAKRKDGRDREGWGAVVNSVFWKRLLKAQEGSRDLSILLQGCQEGVGRGLCDHTQMPRPRTPLTVPGVPAAGSHAPKLDNCLPSARGGWGDEGSGPPYFVLPQVPGHCGFVIDPERCFSEDVSCDNPNRQLPDSTWYPSLAGFQGPSHTHSQALTSDALLLQSGSKHA